MEPGERPTVCLAMIVRDEAHIIEEGLSSLVGLIDRWVVVDTGSTDRTMEIVTDFFAAHDVPGGLHERPWVDFGINRTQALELAAGQADYTWMFDADDVLVGDLDLSDLGADAHQLRFGPDLTFWRTQIFRSNQPWRYEGVLHEYPMRSDGELARVERIEGDYHVIARSAGARSKGDKTARDVEVLTAARERDPSDPRTVFYLAQSHRDAGHHEQAVEMYELRARMGGWDEEVYVSRLELARGLVALERPWPEAQAALLEAWSSRPHRLEALYELARHHRLAGDFAAGHLFGSWGADMDFPVDDLLFVASDIHRWRLLDEAAICAFYIGRQEESERWCRRLLTDGYLPESERNRVWENLAFALDALRERDQRSPATISLLHATHRSPEAALAVRAAWIDSAVHPSRIEHIFAMDDTDVSTVAATEGLDRVVVPATGDGVTAVTNWNAAAAIASGDLLFVIADDLHPPAGWDRLLDALLHGVDPATDEVAVKVTDSTLADDVLLRHPVITRAFHRRFGLWDPAFRGVYCDEDLTRRAATAARIVDGRALVLEHRHPHFDPDAPESESHRRMNSTEEYEHGLALMAERWDTADRVEPVVLVDPALAHDGF